MFLDINFYSSVGHYKYAVYVIVHLFFQVCSGVGVMMMAAVVTGVGEYIVVSAGVLQCDGGGLYMR